MKRIFILLLIIRNILLDCWYYDNHYNCGWDGDKDKNNWDSYCFQTPTRNGNQDPEYRDTYQDMHYIVGYAKERYYDNQKYCEISVYTRVNTNEINLDTTHEILYTFGNIEQRENYFIIDKDIDPHPDGISISVRVVKKGETNTLYELKLEKEYFIWNIPPIDHDNTTYNENGQKGAIVELFGWPYEDIIEESDFLKLSGYLGVKIIPPNEHIMTEAWMESNGLNPWEYFIQPVSYKIKSRFGDKKDLINMINRCREKGIRVYSQVVINHMTHQGNDIYFNHYENNCNERNVHWPGKNASAGSPFFTVKGRTNENLNPYTNKAPIFEYPSVPYCGTDFHCRKEPNSVANLFDGWVFNSGNSPSLQDLDTSKDYVRQRIADFLTELLSCGITGISVYNAKYIHPNDYFEIFKKIQYNLGGGSFPNDFIIILEIQIGTLSNEYNELLCSDNDYNFAAKFEDKLKSLFLWQM